MKTPVAFVIFNRPSQTKRVFEAIRQARPEKLFVISDGPRTEAERSLVMACRAVIDTIDWPCDLQKRYADRNLGCGGNEASGLDWVFSQVDRAIILEDDCLPHPSFFPFCEELLTRYENDTRVMHISGNFFQHKNKHFNKRYFKNDGQRPDVSYFASAIPHLWGWATWARAWRKYEYNLDSWPAAKKAAENGTSDSKTVRSNFADPAVYEYWSRVWDRYHAEHVNNYDAQWVFACVSNGGICLNPTVNLITNIGFGPDATHTRTMNECAEVPTQAMPFPLTHPDKLIIDRQADRFTMAQNFGVDKKMLHRALRPIKNAFPKTYWKIRRILKK